MEFLHTLNPLETIVDILYYYGIFARDNEPTLVHFYYLNDVLYLYFIIIGFPLMFLFCSRLPFKCFFIFFFEGGRQRERERALTHTRLCACRAQREGDRGSEVGSVLTAVSLTWGSN